MNGMQNDLPMATRDALEAHENSMPKTPRGGSGESTLDPSIFPGELLNRINILEGSNADAESSIRGLQEKFRTLQTRCNSVLAMQAQISTLLTELKIGTRAKTPEPKKSTKRR